MSDKFVKSIVDMYGEDSDVFRVRVAGEFPQKGDDIFIPLSLLEKSIMTEYIPKPVPFSIHIGCDVARYGNDKTVIGYKVDEKVFIHKRKQGQDTMRTAADIIVLYEELREKYHFKDTIPVKVDDGGVGGGVVDRLRQIKRNEPQRFSLLEIFPVHFGQRIQHKHYYDSTTYMMSVVKKLLQPFDEDGNEKPVELILPDDDELIGQLSTRKYTLTENSKIRIESKEAMKKRGQHSPDEADCLLLLCLPVKINSKHTKNPD